METINSTSSGDTLLFAKEVADILKIKICTVYELARSGSLPSVHVTNRAVRFRRSSIEKYMSQRESSSQVGE